MVQSDRRRGYGQRQHGDEHQRGLGLAPAPLIGPEENGGLVGSGC